MATNKIRCPVFCLTWTPEGRRLITGASSGEFTLWNGLTFNFETILQVLLYIYIFITMILTYHLKLLRLMTVLSVAWFGLTMMSGWWPVIMVATSNTGSQTWTTSRCSKLIRRPFGASGIDSLNDWICQSNFSFLLSTSFMNVIMSTILHTPSLLLIHLARSDNQFLKNADAVLQFAFPATRYRWRG